MIRILIVEDDPNIQFIYKEMMKLFGFEIIGLADNGETAVEMFKSFKVKPDVILMDHRMPEKDGIEASKEILALDNHSKIIFASADREIREKALLIGAVSFKQKPFGFELLKQNIEKAYDE